MRNVYSWLTAVVLGMYRLFAMTALIGVLIGAVLYSCFVGFYLANKTWVAPTVIHAQDPPALELRQQVLTIGQSVSSLQIDIDRNQSTVAEMRKHLIELTKLQPALNTAVPRERRQQLATGRILTDLDNRKKGDNARTEAISTETAKVENKIDSELAAGLITKGEAALQKS